MLAPRVARLITCMAAALALALPVASESSAAQNGAGAVAHPKAWPAVAGLSAQQVIELAKSVPAGTDAADVPWCDSNRAIRSALATEYGEKLVAAEDGGVQLWGSGREGTWTMVLPRQDETSCIVVSGIGFRDATAPGRFFDTAGLG